MKFYGDLDRRVDMSVRTWKGGFMVKTLLTLDLLVPMSYSKLWNYIYCPSRRHREAPGNHGRPRETTEAGSHAQVLARFANLVLHQHPQHPQNYAYLERKLKFNRNFKIDSQKSYYRCSKENESRDWEGIEI